MSKYLLDAPDSTRLCQEPPGHDLKVKKKPGKSARSGNTRFDPKVVKAFLEILDEPHSQDIEGDKAAECGVLPGFRHIREIVQEAL